MFHTPDVPEPKTVRPPTRSDEETLALADEQRKRYQHGFIGRAASMFAGGGTGLGANPGFGAVAKLLGGT